MKSNHPLRSLLILIRLLIQARGVRIAATDINGETALHRACLKGNHLVVSEAFLGLRAYGCPSEVHRGSADGEGSPAPVVTAADLNRVAAPTGFTPLHVACQVCPHSRVGVQGAVWTTCTVFLKCR